MEYSPQALDHFLHPRCVGAFADISVAPPAASSTPAEPGIKIISGDAGQITRGDALRLSLKLRTADETILDARFQNFGSALSIASASCLCELLVGKSLEAAAKLSLTELQAALGNVPETQHHKPVLALQALDAALAAYRGKPLYQAGPVREAPLCACYQVPESVIEKTVRLQRLKSVDDITAATRAGGGCHTCHPELEEILERCARGEYRHPLTAEDRRTAARYWGTPDAEISVEEKSANQSALSPASKSAHPGLPAAARVSSAPQNAPRTAPDGFVYPDRSPVAALNRDAGALPPRRANAAEWKALAPDGRRALIERVLEDDLRPAIRMDGGDIELVDLQDARVLVRLQGHCRGCHSATSTLKQGVERRLQEAVWPELEVVEVE
jgi:NifU-like protein